MRFVVQVHSDSRQEVIEALILAAGKIVGGTEKGFIRLGGKLIGSFGYTGGKVILEKIAQMSREDILMKLSELSDADFSRQNTTHLREILEDLVEEKVLTLN